MRGATNPKINPRKLFFAIRLYGPRARERRWGRVVAHGGGAAGGGGGSFFELGDGKEGRTSAKNSSSKSVRLLRRPGEPFSQAGGSDGWRGLLDCRAPVRSRGDPGRGRFSGRPNGNTWSAWAHTDVFAT